MKTYLIGYEKLNFNQFVDLLKRANIDYLIDIRENPYSKKKEFSKNFLQVQLEKEGIHYIHFRKLGNPSFIRKNYKDTKLVLKKYSDYIESVLTTDLEDKIKNLLTKGNIAFMCLEKNPFECHRTILAYYLLEKGIIDSFTDLRNPTLTDKLITFAKEIVKGK
jgi:uncharacterized protein (DUF488 family)